MSTSNEMYRRIVEAVPEGIWVVDPQGRTIFSNRRMADMLGTDFESMSEQSCFGYVFPDDLDDAQRHFARTLAGDSRPFDFRLRRADGSPIWVSISCMPVQTETKAPVGLLGLFSDITKRKRAEAALRESEERFRNMADTAPVMIWIADPDKSITFFNKCCLNFTGQTLEEKRGDGWIAALHSDDRAWFLDKYSSSSDARQEFCSVIRLRRADGEYRWLRCTGVPRFASDGAFAGYIGCCLDVTEEKLFTERLQASEARRADTQRLAKVGSWERNLRIDKIQWSDEMIGILGLAPSSFKDFLNCVHPKDRKKIVEIDAKVRSSTTPVEVEYRIIRPDGDTRFVRSIVEGVKNDHGELVHIAGATQDVTDQVQIREQLQESEQLLKSAQRLTHVGSWHWDLGVNRVVCSEECKRIFGQPEDYVPSLEGLLQMVTPSDRARVANEIQRGIADKTGCSTEFQLVRPNGDLRTVTFTSQVVLDEENAPRHVFGACQDVTDTRRVQEEAFAGQKLETVGTLANGIAHDFNNLLGGVLAQAELALSEVAAGVNPEEELRAIRDIAIRGSEIVRQLMIYAGKESGGVGRVDLSHVVKEMLELLKVSVSKHAVLETDLARDLPAVRANAAQLRQIVMNLITNASDAIGDRDGVIRVITRLGRESSGRSDALPEGNYLTLEVRDTGWGMSPETQARVFDPFFTTKSASHGLGLAVVSGIVRELGGTIVLTSELNKGSAFRILLLSAETENRASSDAIATTELARPFQVAGVLVVEDEDPLRQAVAKMLRKTGFGVFEAADGSAAIDLLRGNRGKIDVILLDMTTPGASGRQVIAEAKIARPDIRVILTSAYGPEMITDAMSVPHITSFIRKPFQLGDLLKTLRNAIFS